jgi:DNA repair photolyase
MVFVNPGSGADGRGAASNPRNRFLPLHLDLDGEPHPDDLDDPPAVPTTYLRDTSRSVVARNDSPDVGFDASVNPYRGCLHGCVYCLSEATRILMADGSFRPLADVRVGDVVMGTVRRGLYRRYVPSPVLARWATAKPAYRVRLADGTELTASGDHRFLTQRGWKHVAWPGRPSLTRNDELRGFGAIGDPPARADDPYRRGYLCGRIRGDGLLATYRYFRPHRLDEQHPFRLALADTEGLVRTREFLEAYALRLHAYTFQAATPNRHAVHAIRTSSRAQGETIRALIEWPLDASASWARGFLGGIFDAEGSYSDGILRITHADARLIDVVCDCLRRFAFDHVVERRERERPLFSVRVRGGLREHLRLFGLADPAIRRKRSIAGQAVKSVADLRVVAIEPLGVERLVDVSTGTEDFVAEGVVAHNCYARPTHEYLGFSSGLDFETKILVKEDAPERLRQELESPRWKPTVVAMSGVTDCYQPVERRLGLTRRCLEVLAEFRNPVCVITKNALVTRDADVLGALAEHRAAAVHVSVTSLDRELQRRLEPRTSPPSLRLDAVRRLNEAGVPAGVLVAPVVPGLNDHEIPAILEAAARAGAVSAGYVVLRLPHALKDLFEAWLERHVPDRKNKVLNRIRALRGGGLNDPRFGTRMSGEGVFAEQIAQLFEAGRRKAGLPDEGPALSTAAFRRPERGGQLALFDA